MSSTKEKQRFLRKEIIQKKYDAASFMAFLQDDREGGTAELIINRR